MKYFMAIFSYFTNNINFILACIFKIIYKLHIQIGGVAQMVRVSACHAEGRGFESRHSRHNFKTHKK